MTTFTLRIQPSVHAARQQPPREQGSGRRKLSATVTLFAAAAFTTLALTGCGTPPKDLDLSLDKQSAAGVYRIALLPPAQAPAINQLHSWRVKLATRPGSLRYLPFRGQAIPGRPAVR
jgi:hypothetical protein